ncbi:MAG: hypothetical protein ACI9SC_002792 [Gammaproteobacteria bacterium]
MKSKYSLNVVAALFGLLLTFPVNAAWYQVEVIVFDYLSPKFDGELWYENPGLPDRTDSIELITELADGEDQTAVSTTKENQNPDPQARKRKLIPYLQLSKDNLRLEGIQRVLKLSNEYRPLMHLAWQQPGLSSQRARAIHIQMFEEVDESSSGQPENIVALGNETILANENYQVLDLIFDGTIRLRSSKFLHVDVDIAYFPEYFSGEGPQYTDDDSLFVQQQADYVRLQESRKIRLNEIHYFDHPLFGLILRVSRLSAN